MPAPPRKRAKLHRIVMQTFLPATEPIVIEAASRSLNFKPAAVYASDVSRVIYSIRLTLNEPG